MNYFNMVYSLVMQNAYHHSKYKLAVLGIIYFCLQCISNCMILYLEHHLYLIFCIFAGTLYHNRIVIVIVWFTAVKVLKVVI